MSKPILVVPIPYYLGESMNKNTEIQIVLNNENVSIPKNYALIAVKEGERVPFVGLFFIGQAKAILDKTFEKSGYSKIMPKGALKYINECFFSE
jgi:hypothetical protein